MNMHAVNEHAESAFLMLIQKRRLVRFCRDAGKEGSSRDVELSGAIWLPQLFLLICWLACFYPWKVCDRSDLRSLSSTSKPHFFHLSLWIEKAATVLLLQCTWLFILYSFCFYQRILIDLALNTLSSSSSLFAHLFSQPLRLEWNCFDWNFFEGDWEKTEEASHAGNIICSASFFFQSRWWRNNVLANFDTWRKQFKRDKRGCVDETERR